jgi:hypothetical protein
MIKRNNFDKLFLLFMCPFLEHTQNPLMLFRSTTKQLHRHDKWEKDTEKYGRDMDDGGCLR